MRVIAPGGGHQGKRLRWLAGAAAAVALGMAVLPLPAHAGEVFTHWQMPIVGLPEAERPTGPSMLGTIALPVRARPTSTRWAKVMNASLDQPVLDRMAREAGGLSLETEIALVQRTINRAIRLDPQITNCTDDGYWAPAQETVARGMGDCFDIAIAKMEMLRRLGVPGRDLYLTTGWFGALPGGRGRESVALLVRLGDRFWLLPENADHAFPIGLGDGEHGGSGFTPVVTYGVGMTWVHGRMVPAAALTSVAAAGVVVPAPPRETGLVPRR